MNHLEIYNKYKLVGPSGIDTYPLDMSDEDLRKASKTGYLWGNYFSGDLELHKALNNSNYICVFKVFHTDFEDIDIASYVYKKLKKHPEMATEIVHGTKYFDYHFVYFSNEKNKQKVELLKELYESRNKNIACIPIKDMSEEQLEKDYIEYITEAVLIGSNIDDIAYSYKRKKLFNKACKKVKKISKYRKLIFKADDNQEKRKNKQWL